MQRVKKVKSKTKEQPKEILLQDDMFYKTIVESANDFIYVVDKDMYVKYINHCAAKRLKYKSKDLIGKPLKELFSPKYYDEQKGAVQRVLESGKCFSFESKTCFLGEDTWLDIKLLPIKNSYGNVKEVVGIAMNISERKRIETALQESESKFRILAETSAAGVLMYQEDKFIYVNNALEDITGYKRNDILKMKFWEHVHPDFQNLVKERGLSRLRGESVPKQYELKIVTKDGKEKWVYLNAGQITKGDKAAVVATVLDITNHKQTEAELQRRIEFERLITTISTNFINIMPDEIDYAFNNALKLIGEFAGVDRSYIVLFRDNLKKMDNTHEWCAKGIKSNSNKLKETAIDNFPWFNKIIKKHEVIYIPDVSLLPKEAGSEKKQFQLQGIQSLVNVPMVYGRALIGFLGFDSVTFSRQWANEDIALLKIVGEIFVNAIEHQEEENAVRDSERKYRTLFEDSRDAIYMTTLDGQFIDINHTGLDLFGYTREEIFGQGVQTLFVEPSEQKKFQNVIDKHRAVKNYEVKLHKKDGTEMDCLITSTVRLSYEGEIIGYQGIIRDITMHKQAENHLKESYEKLERILDETVIALATTTEKRDPYTAGHQQRVANLASAIAREMGLSEEQVEGVRVAGILHDIGKICIPAEILNKPSHLSPIEFDIIKTHPQASHDIVKTIEFPWPIAQILYQHHERLDGSGYPQKLTGEAILLEAKIISVADVVEAMLSNRPYRPALSIEDALGEIIKNKGSLYFAKVVDTCVKLFRENKFSFE
jgi:PAS domain S-box-containing protein/putative nucleotidyltransferase with HDIG domain